MPGSKWTVDEKMNIVLEGMMPGANISEVCRRHGGPRVCITGGVKHSWLVDELDFSPGPPRGSKKSNWGRK